MSFRKVSVKRERLTNDVEVASTHQVAASLVSSIGQRPTYNNSNKNSKYCCIILGGKWWWLLPCSFYRLVSNKACIISSSFPIHGRESMKILGLHGLNPQRVSQSQMSFVRLREYMRLGVVGSRPDS